MKARSWLVVSGCLLGLGLLARLVPLLDAGGRLLRQFPTEDGYLMLTLARNIGLGNGMSIAAGTIASNGTQPLATYLFALPFWLTGGERVPAVAMILLIQVVIAAWGAFLLHRLALRHVGDERGGRAAAALCAAVWFASPLAVVHTMNCLETGLYAASVLLVLSVFLTRLERAPHGGVDLGGWTLLGLLLGFAFWARNDGVLLACSLGFVHLLGVGASAQVRVTHRVVQLGCSAVTMVLPASPWLVNNLLQFGHLMPLSGRAESHGIVIGENLGLLGPTLFEYLTVVGLVPERLETNPGVALVTSLIVAVTVAWALRDTASQDGQRRSLLYTIAAYGLGLSLFYGLVFGAGHFMSRYFFPLAAPILLTATGIAVRRLPALRTPGRAPAVAVAGAALAALLLVALNVRIYLRGADHAHFQVVEWVSQHVPEQTWVGAVQTGTLGFFHDRTINLDGKVNPEALEARMARRIPEYVVQRDIQYLVDWVGIEVWLKYPVIEENFDLVLRDTEENLSVLQRHGAPVKQELTRNE